MTKPYKRKPAKQRLFAKVKNGPSGCIEWAGHKTPNGYGVIGGLDVYKKVSTHRLSYEIHFGPVPKGMHVCHKCDNRACINPDHLFLGSASENMQDMYRKGRQPNFKGERHPGAKLSEADVLRIKELLATGIVNRRIAEMFKVSPTTICTINTGRKWTHLQQANARAQGKAVS